MFNLALSTLRMGKVAEANDLYAKYVNLAVANKESMQGAIGDLKDLVEKNIMKDQAVQIIKNIFHQNE
jgi:uncharacterized protein Yka (UPF0111/DUF47 family)